MIFFFFFFPTWCVSRSACNGQFFIIGAVCLCALPVLNLFQVTNITARKENLATKMLLKSCFIMNIISSSVCLKQGETVSNSKGPRENSRGPR